MKKKLNTDAIKNELEGSVFFPSSIEEPAQQEQVAFPPPFLSPLKEQGVHAKVSNQTSLQASNNATKHASTVALSQEIIERIRKIVKNPAKEEVLYVRLSKEEKNQLGDIAYTYQRQGRKTSDNELGRIAINFLIADYQVNGEQSILAKVIEALNA